MKYHRIFLFFIILFIVAGVFYWALFAPKEELPRRIYKTLKEQEKHADLLLKQAIFEEVSGGVKYWQLSAETAAVNKSTGIASLQAAEGTFFKNNKPALRFRSPAAVWDMQKKEIYLDQPLGYDIALENKIAALIKSHPKGIYSFFNLPIKRKKEQGYWFQANNLSWKLLDQKLLCRGGIFLNKGEIAGYAEKLESDVGLEKIRLDGNPRIIMLSENAAPVTLEAQSFEILTPQDLVLAQGAPKVTWQDATVSALSARYLQNQKKLELDGDVRIRYKDILAWGKSAYYLTADQKVVLSGSAAAKQGENKLSGEKVLVSLKDKKISLLGKGKVVIEGGEK